MGAQEFKNCKNLERQRGGKPPLSSGPSRTPARTRGATRGRGAPANRPTVSRHPALIAESCSGLAWGRPALRLRRVFAARRCARVHLVRLRRPALQPADRSAFEVGGARSGLSRWGCAKGDCCPARCSRARNRSVKCGGARAPVRSADPPANKHACGRLRGYPTCVA